MMILQQTRGALSSGGFDRLAARYIRAVETAGATVTTTQRDAINSFIKECRNSGWISSMRRMYLPIWGLAAPNAIDMLGDSSGTFTSGITHASGYVQGNGSTGLFRFNGTPSSLGLSNASGFLFTLCNQGPTATGAHIGVLQGSNNRCTIAANPLAIGAEYTSSATGIYTPNLYSLANQTGVMCFSRTATNSFTLYQRKTAGFSTLGTNTNNETAAVPAVEVCVMARGRTATTQDSLTNGRHGAFGIGLGMDQTNVSSFTLAIKNLWETCTGLTLP